MGATYHAVRRRVLQDWVFRTADPPPLPFAEITREGRRDRRKGDGLLRAWRGVTVE